MKQLTATVIPVKIINKLNANSLAKRPKVWKYTKGYARQFKDLLTTHLVVEQSCRCAYCGFRLRGDKHHRDHIAPQEKYPEYIFEPSNIVLACYTCDSDYKRTTDTIETQGTEYGNCSFKIVHPYFDDPTQHIRFVSGNDGILITTVSNSAKGTFTIDLFKLASSDHTIQRAKDAEWDSDVEHLDPSGQVAVLQLLQTPLRMNTNRLSALAHGQAGATPTMVQTVSFPKFTPQP